MTKLVFSYSHADEKLRDELDKNLSALKRQGLIESWHDRRILAGQEFIGEIDRNFEEADIVLLLVSPDFINSDYCFNVEMKRALERHAADEASVIPVILRMCHWHDLPFGKLLAATPDGKPVVQYPSLDEGFYHVVDAIKRAIIARPKAPAVVVGGNNFALADVVKVITSTAAIRSSNLHIKKSFADRDRDSARVDCFEFIAKYFENSLNELKQRNPSIDVEFRRIDANSFESKIYVSGQRKCVCGIWTGSKTFGGDIAFSHSGVSTGSFNESMSINDDGYTLGFKPMGMAYTGRDRDKLLTNEGTAEYFWEMFIQPLQR